MVRVCLECGKQFDEGLSVLNMFCSAKCAKKQNLREEMTTYERDEITCPYCNEQIIMSEITDDIVEHEVVECPYCEKDFILEMQEIVQCTAYPTDKNLELLLEKEENEYEETGDFEKIARTL